MLLIIIFRLFSLFYGLSYGRINFFGDFGCVAQELFGSFTAHSEALLAEQISVAGFANDSERHSSIKKVAGIRNAFVPHDIKLAGPKRSRDFVFHDLDLHTVADDLFALFDLGRLADLYTH